MLKKINPPTKSNQQRVARKSEENISTISFTQASVKRNGCKLQVEQQMNLKVGRAENGVHTIAAP